MSERSAEYEYIVVGSGAGGGTLAARLAEAGHKVLVLEAGGDPKTLPGGVRWDHDRDSLPDDYDVPVFHAISTESDEMRWDFWVRHYQNDAQQKLDPKYLPDWEGEYVDGVLYPRVGALGGCTSHNAMIMIYPHNKDWDDIADITGDPTWKSRNMRKYFQRMENCRYRPFWRWIYFLFRWNPTRHGFYGWLSIEKAVPKTALGDRKLVKTILGSAFAAITNVRRPWHRTLWFLRGKGDHNDWRLVTDDSVGIRYAPLSTHEHRRNGTREFLREVERKYPGNLTIELDALVTRVLFDDRDRAIGVEYQKGERLYQAHYQPSETPGTVFEVKSSREVILAGGAFNTPQLLMLSGIGPKEELEKHGIEIRVDLPGVGKNLQDRYEVGITHVMKQDWEVLDGAKFERGDPQYQQWERGKGVYTTNGAILAVIKKSEGKRPLPDLFCFAVLGKFRGYEPNYSRALVDHHDYLTWAVLKAHTINKAGRVSLASKNPRTRPVINFHYFDEGDDKDQFDLDSVVEGIKFVRKTTDKIEHLIQKEEAPGKDIATRDQLRRFVKDNAWGHHASCTCKIGRSDDEEAVLDGNFRVFGVQGLRVVDASVFPKIPGFFIVTSVYMVGEKAADVILADAGTESPKLKMISFWQTVKNVFRSIWKWIRWPLGAIVAALVLIVGLSFFIYEPLSAPSDEKEEMKVIRDTADLLTRKLSTQYTDEPQFLRDTHPKANACVRANFTIAPELEREKWWSSNELGDLGIFATPGQSYQAWIRFSNASDSVTPDSEEDFRGMGIKLFRVAGDKLPVPSPGFVKPEQDDDDEKKTQDFLFIAHNTFFAGNVQHFHDFFESAVKGGGADPRTNPYLLWHALTHPRGTWNAFWGRKVYPSIADIKWFSVAPFKLGKRTVKYGAFPCERTQFHPPTAERSSDDYLKRRLREQLDPEWGGDICLNFNIQFRANDDQPIENTLVPWDPKESPWRTVAKMIVPAQKFTSEEQTEFCQTITFNPWHSLPAHEPEGGINRARRDVMFALQKKRLKENGRKRFEPTGNEYFYPGAKFPWSKPPPPKG